MRRIPVLVVLLLTLPAVAAEYKAVIANTPDYKTTIKFTPKSDFYTDGFPPPVEEFLINSCSTFESKVTVRPGVPIVIENVGVKQCPTLDGFKLLDFTSLYVKITTIIQYKEQNYFVIPALKDSLKNGRLVAKGIHTATASDVKAYLALFNEGNNHYVVVSYYEHYPPSNLEAPKNVFLLLAVNGLTFIPLDIIGSGTIVISSFSGIGEPDMYGFIATSPSFGAPEITVLEDEND